MVKSRGQNEITLRLDLFVKGNGAIVGDLNNLCLTVMRTTGLPVVGATVIIRDKEANREDWFKTNERGVAVGKTSLDDGILVVREGDEVLEKAFVFRSDKNCLDETVRVPW